MADEQLKGGHFHAVRFYEDDTSLCRIVSGFVAEGITAGQPALILATAAHNTCILENLSTAGFDVAALQRTHDLLLLDARDTLNSILEDGFPNPERFHAVASAALKRVDAGRGNTIRAYGEMVDLLWKDGMCAASIKLEMLWNKLASTHDFSLLCGYAMGNFYKDVTMQDVCRQHTHLVSETGTVSAMAN